MSQRTAEGKGIDIAQVLGAHKADIDAVLERYIPRRFNRENLEAICGNARYAYDLETATKAMAEPIWEVLDRGGKRWRPTLLLIVAEALGGRAEKVLDFAAICELIHNGTLVVDDIEDGSQLRRGKPCLHLVYGLDVAVNAGNAMYFLPLLVLRDRRESLPQPVLIRAYELYVQEMINVHFGQAFDIWWHSGRKDPTVEEYLQMCAYKTGTLARLSAKLSALVCGGTDAQIEAIGRFAESIGVAFQIQDDILNLVGEKFGEAKGVGEDIHEGKRTLMVIHSLAHAGPADARRLRAILLEHSTDERVIQEAIAIIEGSGSIAFARDQARAIVRQAWQEVETVIPENGAKGKLKAFADYLIERNI
ncbi:MAG: polyprenyl synthetase family protein [Planctomycetes bacterium]|nr:polyprenyl synthetase family protein [Planctomycetota bacterium]